MVLTEEGRQKKRDTDAQKIREDTDDEIKTFVALFKGKICCSTIYLSWHRHQWDEKAALTINMHTLLCHLVRGNKGLMRYLRAGTLSTENIGQSRVDVENST